MPKKPAKATPNKQIETLVHDEAHRRNIPTAEFQSVMHQAEQAVHAVKYPRLNRDLDPQLVWRGKDQQDWTDLVVPAPPVYIQEKIHPKVLIDDLIRQSKQVTPAEPDQYSLFSDFNGLPSEDAKTEFYQHDANWTNRMILGDSLQVMASLAEREGLRGQVQCIYFDPPYGIKFNSNFQWSTTSRDVKDGNTDHITREPEQVKAFRDTWLDGIHSYLTYLRDRLTVAKDLLNQSGSIFVQIGDENAHRVRVMLDEVFGENNHISTINYVTTSGFPSLTLTRVGDTILWYAKNISSIKYRRLFNSKEVGDDSSREYRWLRLEDGKTRAMTQKEVNGEDSLPVGSRRWRHGPLTSSGFSDSGSGPFDFQGRTFSPGPNNHWKVKTEKLPRLAKSGLLLARSNSISYQLFADNYPVVPLTNFWTDTKWGFDASEKLYVVQTNSKIIEKCLLMATDPGDLVLDPTCGSGTTAYVAEQWGRRWITIDTSRVSLALARGRIMGARYPFYLLADSPGGRDKESELSKRILPQSQTRNNIRQGFVYERVPHITLKSIANNAEIDVIWERHQPTLESLRTQLNTTLKQSWQEWQIPREADPEWPAEATKLHTAWWQHRITRQKEIDASIAAKAEYEYLYDKPYEDKRKVRVAGPFTVESLSPHRALIVDENDNIVDPLDRPDPGLANFTAMVIDNLLASGVQQHDKGDRFRFTTITPWPGQYIGAEAHYNEGETEKRAAIFIGPEFGTVSKPDLVSAAREAGDAGFDILIACAFNFDAHSSEFNKLGRIPVLKARMNADLHMAQDLKNTGKGNLFVIFGEPDIVIHPVSDPPNHIKVEIKGVDIFPPNSGQIRSDDPGGIAVWFLDTDYNEESFFVRHAYFPGTVVDPYKALKTTLKAEINEEAWASLASATSRPFPKPASGRIAVKVINHLGDEVMKVFRIE